ncbi:AIPR family protein [Actinomadura sp. ATCC 39365]
MEVAGYHLSDDGHVLDLVVANYGHLGQTLAKDQAIRQLRWAKNFAIQCHAGHHLKMEEASAAYDMVQDINAHWSELDKIRIFLITDGRTTIDSLEEDSVGSLPVIQHVWDIERLHRLVASGRHEEPINIDFKELGSPVACLPASGTDGDHQCFMAILPGQVLADMYEKHGTKLLQRNVRAFLQARGKVNKGLNETIRNDPGRFLAYNNGISVTATGVQLTEGPTGPLLASLSDLQIVNGGQTTASLHHALKRDKADLSRIQVPAKITVVEPELLDQLIPRISLYANSQNAINEADFQSNSPFHVELERLSRRLWAPAPPGSKQETHWYYERVRGQYDVDRGRQPKGAPQKKFVKENPSLQRFTKTDVAKFEMVFLQLPHIASWGAQKCFRQWTLDVLSHRTELPDEQYFRNLIAKAIFFTQARREIMRLNPGAGYPAQVTAHTLARLVPEVALEAILGAIWRNQALPSEVTQAVGPLSTLVREVLLDTPSGGNVTEWAKKEACTKRVMDIHWVGV